MTDPKPSLASALVKKLAEVMSAVKRIPKNGYNDFHKYKFATEADVVEVIRQELASRNVMLFPSVDDVTRDPVGEKGNVVTTLRMTFTFMDGDTGETVSRGWAGFGADKDDKGGYKAMTGGEKYFLLKTFLIPTGDDPEIPPKDKRQDATRKPQNAPGATIEAKTPSGPTIGDSGSKSLWELVRQLYPNSESQKTAIRTLLAAHRVEKTVDLPVDGSRTLDTYKLELEAACQLEKEKAIAQS